MDILPFNAVHIDLVDTANAAALARLDAYKAVMSKNEVTTALGCCEPAR